MKLRTVSLTARVAPEFARDTMATTLLQQGWSGRWLDPWSAMAHQGTEGGNVIAGPFAPFFEIRWEIVAGPFGETVVHIEQTRNTWLGKGGVLDGKRAGKRFDTLIAALVERLPTTAVGEHAQ